MTPSKCLIVLTIALWICTFDSEGKDVEGAHMKQSNWKREELVEQSMNDGSDVDGITILTSTSHILCWPWRAAECKITNCGLPSRVYGFVSEENKKFILPGRNNKNYMCDGFVRKGSCNKYSYKVPNHCNVTYNCKTNRFVRYCCGILARRYGYPRWIYSKYGGLRCPRGW